MRKTQVQITNLRNDRTMSSFSMTPWDKSADSRERGTRASKTDVKIGGMTNKRKKNLPQAVHYTRLDILSDELDPFQSTINNKIQMSQEATRESQVD